MNRHQHERGTASPASTYLAPPLGQKDLQELELLHHHVYFLPTIYMERDALTSCRTWWMATVSKSSAIAESVKDLVLSISSAHLSHLRERKEFKEKSIAYYLRSVANHRRLVDKVVKGSDFCDVDTLDAVAFTSFSLSVRAKITTLELVDSYQNLCNLLSWFDTARGHGDLSTWIVGSPHLSSFIDTPYFKIVMTQHSTMVGSIPKYMSYCDRRPNLDLFNHLYGLIHLETSDQKDLAVIWLILKRLEWMYMYWMAESEDVALLSIFMANSFFVPKILTTLAHRKSPAAIAILLYYICAERERAFSHIWWLTGHVDERVESIASLLPADWQWIVAWPLGVVRGELDIREYPAWALEQGHEICSDFRTKSAAAVAQDFLCEDRTKLDLDILAITSLKEDTRRVRA